MAHSWIIRFLEHRIADKRILRLIAKWLKVGTVEDGRRTHGVCGAPQGAVMAPRTQKVTLRSRQCSVRTAGWRAVARCHGQRDAVPEGDLVVADEDFLDEQPQDALAFQYVAGPRRRTPSRKARGQRLHA